MTDFAHAMRDPKSCYNEPKDVLNDETLDKEQKIKVLKQWEYDARELSVAEEENMPAQSGDEASMLNRVKTALQALEENS